MKESNLLKLGLAVALAGSVGVASADQVDGTATATVLTPLTVTETTALAYGSVYGGSTAGTVVVSSAGAVSATGGAGFVAATGATQATFAISGALSATIAVTLTPGLAQLDDGTAGGGGAPMTLTAFSNTVLPTALDALGAASFDVGATLNVGASQASGAYSTATGDGIPYTVTVNYN